MLWVYLTKLAIIPHIGNRVDYNNTSWWEATIGGVVLVTEISRMLFEVFVRQAPLIYLLGPDSLGKKRKNPLDSTPSTPPPTTPSQTPATMPA
jgi:hypothetical protein